MTEAREYWANVYADGDMGSAFPDREDAEWFVTRGGFPVVYRIHVRLKREGAPKRYASAEERRAWEEAPNAALMYAESGYQMVKFGDGSMGVVGNNL